MQDKNSKMNSEAKGQTFEKRYDFYWKSLTLYAIAILIYGMLKGTVDEWTFTVVLLDPVVILLVIFIVFTYLGLIIESYRKARLVVGKDYFILKNRFRQRKFTAQDISKIIIGKEIVRGQGKFRIIKVKLAQRKRLLYIRPTSYWKDSEVLAEFSALKKNINK